MRLILVALVLLTGLVGLADTGVAPSLTCAFSANLLVDSESDPPASGSTSSPASVCTVGP